MKRSVLSVATALLAVAGIAFSGCQKDVNSNVKDTEKPTINVSGPKKGTKLAIGATVHFEADFEDNVALRSYKIDIHNAFDGHKHEATRHGDDGVPFAYQHSWDLSGKKNAHIHHHEIMIPKEINGKPVKGGAYHFMVYCTDAARNESHIEIDVELVAESEHEEAHFHLHSMPTEGQAYTNAESIKVDAEAHSPSEKVKNVMALLLPTEAVGKPAAEMQAYATPEKCFAVIVTKDVNPAKNEYDFEGEIQVGQPKDNASTPKAIERNKGKYVVMLRGETEDGDLFYSKGITIEIK